MNFPERITIPVDEEMKETLLQLASNELNSDGKPMKLGEYCRKGLQILINKVNK